MKIAHQSNDNFTTRATQTLNDFLKTKDVQATAYRMTNAGCQATNYDIADTMGAAEEKDMARYAKNCIINNITFAIGVDDIVKKILSGLGIHYSHHNKRTAWTQQCPI
jgi:hypothetical protein